MKPISPDVNGLVVDSDGAQRWFLKGQLHREDGPAVLFADGGREWWQHGELHREGGAAIELADGTREWWHRGRQRNGRAG